MMTACVVRRVFGFVLFGFLSGSVCLAATNRWQGGTAGSPGSWENPQNWSAGKAPAAGDGLDVLISGGCQAYPILDKEAQTGGNLLLETGSSLALNGRNLSVAGNVSLMGGTLNATGSTVSVSGSLIAADTSVASLTLDKNSSIVFVSPRPAVLDTGGRVASPLAGQPLQTIIVDKPGGILLLTNRIVVLNGSLKVKAGRLEPVDGGAVWMGVAQRDKTVLDVALAITQTVTPDLTPDVTAAIVPSTNRPVVVSHPVIGPAIPASVALTNIARFAAIRGIPYTAMVRALVDPDEQLRTMVQPEAGTPVKGTRYAFRYDQPQSIAQIRWANVNGPWAILADTTGDGRYDRLLRLHTEGVLSNPGGVWRSRTWVINNFWPAVKAYGIQVVNPARTMDVYDFQILCPADTVVLAAGPAPAPDVPDLTAGAPVAVPEPPLEKQFLKGFHIEGWMFDVNGWVSMNKTNRPAFKSYKPFTNFVAEVKRYHANTLNLWPPKAFGAERGKGTYELDLLWPSRYDKWTIEENALQAIAEACRANGIKLMTMDRCIYPKKLEEFPKTDTRDIPAPYIPRLDREYLKGVVREEVESGVDGVGIGYDEQQGHLVNPAKADDVTKAAFRARYKVEVPGKAEDTDAYRRWVLFGYEQFASYLAEAAKAAKAANRRVWTKTAVHTCLGCMWNRRIDVNIAEDILGHTADLDYMRAYAYEDNANLGHYITACVTKRMVAANPGKGPASLHNCPWADDPVKYPGYYLECTPAYMYGPPIISIMHGGRMPLYWRENFIFYGGYDKYVEQAFSILDTLAAWGAKDAKAPRQIMVLKSRASEDWWQVRQRYNPDGNPLDQTRGFLYEKWLMEFLLSNGYPFQMAYLDQPGDFARDLAKADLIILPFPYSVSQEAFQIIEKAVGKGTRLLLFDRQGETDEWGASRARPLFADLVASGKAVFVGDDMTAIGQYPAVQRTMRETVDRLLGPDKPVFFEPFGNDVEFTCLETSKGDKLLCLINWTDRNVQVDAGVTLPRGTYRILQRNLTGASKTVLNGKEKATGADLGRFRVALAPWEVKVLDVRRE